MVSKKGYIKTLEAVIAVIIIIAVSYTLIPRHIEAPPEPPLVVQGAMNFINEKIELNDSLRELIIDKSKDISMGTISILESLIKENKPGLYDFTCLICSDNNICFGGNLSLFKKPIYVSDIFIASSEGREPSPKIVRIWFIKSPIEEGDFINAQAYSDFKSANLNKCERK